MDKYVEAEKRLAELLGWQVNEQVVWPKWARDNERAFELMVEHGCYPHAVFGPPDTGKYLIAVGGVGKPVAFEFDAESKEAAVRFAIVQAVIAKLEGEKK